VASMMSALAKFFPARCASRCAQQGDHNSGATRESIRESQVPLGQQLFANVIRSELRASVMWPKFRAGGFIGPS
jgi:hypothetical protein